MIVVPDWVAQLRSEADAYLLLEALRWGSNGAHVSPSCPHCGAAGRQYFLKPASGASRGTRTGAASQRRVWRCSTCRQQYSVLIGTILQGTRISLLTWLTVISSTAEVTPAEVTRQFQITPESARHLIRRIGEAKQTVRRCLASPAGDTSTLPDAPTDAYRLELLRVLLQFPDSVAAAVRDAAPATRPRKPPEGPWHDYGIEPEHE